MNDKPSLNIAATKTSPLDRILNVIPSREDGKIVFTLELDPRAPKHKEIAELFATTAKRVFLRPSDADIKQHPELPDTYLVAWPENNHFPGKRTLEELQRVATRRVILGLDDTGPSRV